MSATGRSGEPATDPLPIPDPVIGFAWSAERKGVAGPSLAAFLAYHDVHDSPYSGPGLERWGTTPPVVRVASGATARQVGQVQRAVEIINSVLPRN